MTMDSPMLDAEAEAEAMAVMDQAVARTLEAVPETAVADSESPRSRHVFRLTGPVVGMGWLVLDVWEPTAPAPDRLAKAANAIRCLGRAGLERSRIMVSESGRVGVVPRCRQDVAHLRSLLACPSLVQLVVLAQRLEGGAMEAMENDAPGRLVSLLCAEGWRVRLAPHGEES